MQTSPENLKNLMEKKSSVITFLLYSLLIVAIPSITILFTLKLVTLGIGYSPEEFSSSIEWLIKLTIISSSIPFLLCILFFKLHKQINNLKEEKKNFEETFRKLQWDNLFLQSISEINLVCSVENDLKNILSEAIDIIGRFINCEEISFFLQNEKKNDLYCYVYSRIEKEKQRKFFLNKKRNLLEFTTSNNSKTKVLQTIPPETIDRRGVQKSYETGRIISSVEESEEDWLDFALPLRIGEEILGVAKLSSIPLYGTHSKRAQKVVYYERFLKRLMRPISLMIKTPTLYDRAVIDRLTRLYTKRHFINQLKIKFSRSKRYKEPLSLIMIDLDHFKSINDTYGHITGDIVLSEISKLIRNKIRADDSAFRYGGEEIAILLPMTPLKKAFELAERLRKKVEKKSLKTDAGKKINVTISLGIAEVEETMKEGKKLVSAADKALYKAKEDGRNQTRTVHKKEEEICWQG